VGRLKESRSVLDDLYKVLADLDERARSEPRLERYRVMPGGQSALDGIPPGWNVSAAVSHIATHGGWWPGEWWFPDDDDFVRNLFDQGLAGPDEDEVRWIRLGVIWERDTFWTPALEVRTETAPIFGFSSQALWSSLVFPNEAALLEAFLITYDEMGLDEFDSVNPFFVEWVTQPPHAHEGEGALRVHDRLVERATAWGTSHRCWVPDLMPLHTDEPWPSEAIRAILGRK
jgi:hypothetical protein